MTDLAEIEAALAAATPGPWEPSKACGLNVVAPNGQIVTRTPGRDLTLGDIRRMAAWNFPDEQRLGRDGMITDGLAESMNAANRTLIANAPVWLAELVERVKAAESEHHTLAAIHEVLAGDWSPDAPGEWEINAERVKVLRELLGIGCDV